MASYDDHIRQMMEMNQYRQMAVGLGALGMGSIAMQNPAGMAQKPSQPVAKDEPEFNPVLLLGDDDEA